MAHSAFKALLSGLVLETKDTDIEAHARYRRMLSLAEAGLSQDDLLAIFG